MESVLISIKPQWVEKIARSKKTIEVRKTSPTIKTPFKCYIYCTQDKYQHLYDLRPYTNGEISLSLTQHNKTSLVPKNYWNGKVIGEFVCDKIDIYVGRYENKDYWDLSVKEWEELKKKSCLTIPQILEYTGDCPCCYGWHISDLVIYDKPKELSEFYLTKPKPMNKWTDNDYCQQCKYHKWIGSMKDFAEKGKPMREKCTLGKPEPICEYTPPLTRPPQSWCYVESLGE